MIAVVADDFTGAAEVGAIGRRYGLAAEVHTTFRTPTDADLVVIDTHTRSSTRDEATRRVGDEVRRLREGGFDWIYKKVDSVLRGHVVAELTRMLELEGLDRALLVPANPSLGQVIRRGQYSIDGRPLDETRFAHDPEHPAATSDVLALLGDPDGMPIAYSEDSRGLPDRGIVVGGGERLDDLVALARCLDERTLASGAAEFFDAALRLRLGRDHEPPPATDGGRAPSGKTLFVLGSTTEPSRTMIARAHDRGVPIVGMPMGLYRSSAEPDGILTAWADMTVDRLEAHDRVIVAVDVAGRANSRRMPVDLLPRHLAELTERVLGLWPDDLHLFVGGGTTASTIVRRLGWRALRVSRELGNGVVTLAVLDGPVRSITVKPGSYPWPERVLEWFG